MRLIFSMISFLMLLSGISFAQCAGTEIEIKVEITTDAYGSETYWTLTDLVGKVVMQGGQGGVYGNSTTYKDSICVLANGCFFFQIFDTYGDGIIAPDGYKLYVNEVLISIGSDDIKGYVDVTAHCPDACNKVLGGLNDIHGHIKGTTILTNNELTLIRNTFVLFPECLAESEPIILLGKTVVDDYDVKIGPLFTTPATQNGFSKDPSATPGLALERAMVALQQGIFDAVFESAVYAEYPEHISGWKFNSCINFPGNVDPPADSSVTKSVLIRANFADPDGMNPYYDINFDRMEHALRPTGLYLAPGSIVTVTVPDSLVGRDYWIRVGSHDWDLTERPQFYRLDRISKKFAIDSTTIEVFNPLGGAISILVPYKANDGIVEVSLSNALESPFFSLKSFHKTQDFNAELNKPGPWAIFETDNVMYTIPKHSIVPGQYDLKQAMLDWDSALQGVNSIIARQIVPDKHNIYLIADLDIRTGVYSIGYPMSNTPLSYTNVPGPAYFIDGPGSDDEVTFHESGHGLAISKFPGEEEALVNFQYIMALNYGLGADLNEAVNYSFVPNTFDIDKSVTHRTVSNSFGSERDITNATTNEVRYQHRGYAHYFEIVNTLGWCPLRNFWKQEFIDFQNGINHGINDQKIDSRILRMSVAAQADLRPLFHVFGILPQDSIALQDTLALIGIQPSIAIYNRLKDYFDLIPADNAAFVNYAKAIYPDLYTAGPVENPDYGVGWHYQKSLTYDAAEALSRTNILQSIIDLYYPNGAPRDNGITDVCCMLDTLSINILKDEVIVTGGVEPYSISIDTAGNLKTVTVIDFDGCESKAQYTLSSGVSDKYSDGIIIYPNPASAEIYLDISGSGNSNEIASLQIGSVNGQVLKVYGRSNGMIDVSGLNEGLYILQIKLGSGKQINKRVLILR